MAPMFLITNEEMMLAADKAGIAGCIPAHNFRKLEDLEACLKNLSEKCKNDFGVNLIVNNSNTQWPAQLKVCLKYKVPFLITSLGSPKKVIEEAHKVGSKVFCDVVDLKYAKIVEEQGADAVIAVNSGAGGHAGNIPATVLLPLLKKHIKIPLISAGGVATPAGFQAMISLGAEALSIGSPFIASNEAPVSQEYKNAVVKYGAEDIVMTTKLSGTPCTVINTDYVKKIGTAQNPVESFLNKNRKVKRWVKALTFYKGMKALEKAAFRATYKTLWCAGPSIEFVDSIKPLKEIVKDITQERK